MAQKIYDPSRQESGPFARRPLTQKEKSQIKHKMNLPHGVPFPKCPDKNRSALRKLEEKGEKWHRERKHSPCVLCACPNTAGLGTTHYGYGRCHLHERKHSKKENDAMALADLTAHQQRHPRVFRDAQSYLDTIEKEAAISDGTFDLTSEMAKARDVVGRMHTRLLHFEKNKDKVVDAVTDGLTKLTAAINSNQSFTEEERIAIMSKLDDLEKRLKCPLTEKGSGGPVEMSDSTMVNLQMAASESLTRIGERVQKLKSIEMITKESLSEWLGRFLQNLKKEFSNLTYTRPDGTFPIIEGVGEAMKNTGDVKRGI